MSALMSASSTVTNPSYSEVVEPLLREHDGDASALLRRYPNFDPDAVPDEMRGWPYLHYACLSGHFHAVRGLVQCGASLLRSNKYGETPLASACANENDWVDVVTWLLSQCADARTTVNWADKSGYMLLHHAATWGETTMVRLLLRYGADISTVSKVGFTATQEARMAAREDTDTEMIRVLEAAERTHAVLVVGEWRPRRHKLFPPKYRATMRTLVVLARAQPTNKKGVITNKDGTQWIFSHYPGACLDLLSEELLQYLFAYVTAPHVPDEWTQKD